jgi:hypothetical protein
MVYTTLELTKKEMLSLRAYNYTIDELIPSEEAKGKVLNELLVISSGRKEMHESGFPFIKIIGVSYQEGKRHTLHEAFYNLGWHDHFITSAQTNTDSLGKNIFRVFPWGSKKNWQVDPHFFPVSTFEIGEMAHCDIIATRVSG